jgi:hypothetical protein
VKGWESEVRILAKACGEMSRGDGAIVACHEMLGTTPPEKGRSRRVRCDGVSQLQEAVHHDEKHLWIGYARSYRTLRDGSFEDAVPVTSCQVTIGLSLRDRLGCLAGNGAACRYRSAPRRGMIT